MFVFTMMDEQSQKHIVSLSFQLQTSHNYFEEIKKIETSFRKKNNF